MKKLNFVTGVICGAIIFGGGSTIASEIIARFSNQPIYVNGQKVDMTAYSINGNNFVRLRDIGRAVNFGVTYDAETDSVKIDSNSDYVEEQVTSVPSPQPEQTELVPITEKILDGSEWSREDFSLQANPAIFDDVYTRGAYNALRQTIVDRDIILSNIDAKGFNPYYKYANYMPTQETRVAMISVFNNVNSCYNFGTAIEPYLKNYYEYPDYRICKVSNNDFFIKPNQDTDGFIDDVNKLTSDREKVIKLNNYLCDKLTYGDTGDRKMEDVFSSTIPTPGKCGDYAYLFSYLCQRVNIPCIITSGENHAWNIVYVDEKWRYVDVVINDTSDEITSRNAKLLVEEYMLQDETPKRTIFCQELLKPGSTK